MAHESNSRCTALSMAAEAGQVGSVALLLEDQRARPTLEVADSAGWTPTMRAAENGHDECVALLVEAARLHSANFDIDATRANGWTALMTAAYSGCTGVVRALCALQADPNFTSRKGFTALMAASYSGYVETVVALLEADAQPDSEHATGTALTVAAQVRVGNPNPEPNPAPNPDQRSPPRRRATGPRWCSSSSSAARASTSR